MPALADLTQVLRDRLGGHRDLRQRYDPGVEISPADFPKGLVSGVDGTPIQPRPRAAQRFVTPSRYIVQPPEQLF